MATYIVKGTTAEDSSPATNLIIAYKADRSDPATIGEELGRVVAAGNGSWEISFDDWSSHVFVVALDPTVEIKYKAKMKDWVIGLLYTDPNIGDYPVEADPDIDNVVTQYGFEEVDIASLENQAKKVYAVDIDFFNSPTLTVITPGMDSKSLKFETGSHAEIRTHISSGSTWSDAGAVDCTLEGMFYLNGTAGNLFHHGASGAGSSTGSAPLEKNGLQIQHAADGTISVYSGNLSEYGASSYLHLNTAAGALLFNQWVHFAFVVESNVPKIYVNGVSQPLTLGNGGYPNTNLSTCHMWNTVPMCLNAKNWDGGVPSNGQQAQYSVVNNDIDAMDEVRITLGLARYTADFVPSTTGYTRFVPGKEATILDPYFYNNILLLRCNVDGSDSFLDEVSTNYNLASGAATQVSATKKFGAAAGKFQTSADYLTIPHHPSYEIGDQLFTMEAWVWIDGAPPSYPQVMGMSDTAGSAASMHWSFAITPQRQISFNIYNAAGNNWLDPISNSGSVTVGEWVHVCVERISTAADGIRVYVNGVQTAASSSNPSLDTHAVANTDLILGGKSTAALNGYLDDVRITVGVNRYGAAFTPPTSEHPPFEYDPLEILTPTSLPYPVEADPYFNDNVSLLPFDNSDGQTVMTDVMGLSWDTFGSAQIDTAESKFGGSSLLLNGATDYLNNGTVSYWKFLHDGTTDYTMECWVRPAAVASSQVVSGTDGASSTKHGVSLNITPDGVFEFLVAKGAGSAVYAARLTGVIPVIANVWVHVAAVVQAGVAKLYVGGVADGSESLASPSQSDADASLVIGKYYAGNSLPLIGHIDDFRITKAVRYTGSFTPPTEALPTTRFVPGTEPPILDPYFADVEALFHFDEGAGVGVLNSEVGGLTITPEGSTATQEIEFLFGGSSIFCPHDSGSFADLVGLADIGTGDFTLEMAINCQPSGNSDSRFLIDCRGTNETGTTNKIRWLFSNGENTLTLYNGGGTLITGLVNVRDGAWHWVAISRKAGTIRMFIDGVQDGADYAGSSQIFIFGNKGMRIGQYSADDIQALGAEAYIDEFRFTRSGRYDANFTVPTKAFPNFEYNPNTIHPLELDPDFGKNIVSLNFDEDAFVDYSPVAATVTTIGTVERNPTIKKFGDGSADFDGLSYLSLGNSAEYDLSTLDFTIESWVNCQYPGGVAGYAIIARRANPATEGWVLGVSGDGELWFRADVGGSWSDQFLSGGVGTVPANTWTHVAVSREGATFRMFVNGSLIQTVINAGVLDDVSTAVEIGRSTNTNEWLMLGKIDDVRVTKGLARYTGTFTLPTAAHPVYRFDPAREPTILDPYFADVESLVQFDEGAGSLTLADEIGSTNWIFEGGAEIVDNVGLTGSCLNITGGTKCITASRPIIPATGDFTLEFFAKAESIDVGGENCLVCQYHYTTAGRAIFGLQNGYLGAFANPLSWARSTTLFPLDTWTHCAFVRNGSTLSVYQGGELVASADWSSVSIYQGGDTVVGSLIYNGSRQSGWDGLLDSFRFTPLARYTSAFIPPAEAFPNFEYDPLEILSTRAVYPVEIDPFFDRVLMLLPLDGSDQSTVITDYSPGGVPVITAQNQAKLLISEKKYGESSAHFDGVNAQLQLTTPPALDLNSDFTVELWCRPTAAGVSLAVFFHVHWTGQENHGLNIYQSTATGKLHVDNGILAAPLSGTNVIPLNEWSHIAVVRKDGVIYVYLDGVLEFSYAAQAYPTTLNAGQIGVFKGDLYDYTGFIDDVRVTQAARYDDAFDPPLAHPLARFEPGKEPTILDADYPSVEVQLNGGGADGDTTIIDSSKHNRTPTVLGVVEYDSGQALFGETTILTSGGALRYDGINWGQTFTAEVYFRTAANSGSQWVMSCRSEKTGREWLVYVNGTQIFLWADGANRIDRGAPAANQWNHIAVTFDGSAMHFFINGIYQAGWATTYVLNEDVMCFGGAYTSASFVNGHIAGARVSRDLIRYTGDFTPPAALFSTMEYDPLEDLSKRTEVDPYFDSVVGLYSLDLTLDDLSGKGNHLTAAAGAVISGTSEKYGVGGLDVSPSSGAARAYTASGSNFGFSTTEDFTVEGWFDFTSLSGDVAIFDMRPTNTTGVTVFLDSTVGHKMAIWDGTTKHGSSGTSLAIAGWRHIAVTRYNGTTRAFLDGVKQWETASSIDFTASAHLSIGASNTPALLGTSPMVGNIDDVRVTGGVARYVADFTPPTEPHPDSRYTYQLEEVGDPLWASVSLLVLMDGVDGTTTFIDRSVSPATIQTIGTAAKDDTVPLLGTVSSARFNGVGNRLRILDGPSTNLGAGDFVIEFTFEFNTLPTTGQCLIGNYRGNTGGWWVAATDANTLQFRWADSFILSATVPGGWALGQQYSVKVERSSGVIYVGLDGVNLNSAANANNLNYAYEVFVGGGTVGYPNDFPCDIWMSNLRITLDASRGGSSAWDVPTALFPDKLP